MKFTWLVKNPSALASKLPDIIREFRELLPCLPPLAGPGGEGAPLFGRGVFFNGPKGQTGEDFSFSPYDLFSEEAHSRPHWGECDTEGKPYGLAVATFLLLSRDRAGDALEVRVAVKATCGRK